MLTDPSYQCAIYHIKKKVKVINLNEVKLDKALDN